MGSVISLSTWSTGKLCSWLKLQWDARKTLNQKMMLFFIVNGCGTSNLIMNFANWPNLEKCGNCNLHGHNNDGEH